MSAPVETAGSPQAGAAVAGGTESRAATPSAWERWGDRLNPLVVKEVRQGLRTRVFWVCFGLMLLACLVLAIIAWVQMRESAFERLGKAFFFSFFVCLGLVHFFVIPYSAYRSLAREREDETWVLLVLTGLGPRRILSGKVASFLVQAGLYASAVGPFLLFSYFLNGIDLPTILTVLVAGAVWLVFLTVLGVCAATLADGRMGRAFVHFVVLGVLFMATIQGLTAAFAMGEAGDRMLRDKDFFIIALPVLGLFITDGWLLFEAAASRLALPTEDYTRGPRRALVTQWVLALISGLGLWWFEGRPRDVAEIFGLLGALHLIPVGLFTVSDVDGQARPLRASTRPWSLLRPGALRGFRLMVLLTSGWSVLWVAVAMASKDWMERGISMSMAVLGTAVYTVLFYSVALLVGRLRSLGQFNIQVSTRLLFVALVASASAVPPLVAVLVGLEANDGLLNLFNPIVGLVNFGSYDYTTGPKMTWPLLGFVAGISAVVAYCADRVLADREKQVHTS